MGRHLGPGGRQSLHRMYGRGLVLQRYPAGGAPGCYSRKRCDAHNGRSGHPSFGEAAGGQLLRLLGQQRHLRDRPHHLEQGKCCVCVYVCVYVVVVSIMSGCGFIVLYTDQHGAAVHSAGRHTVALLRRGSGHGLAGAPLVCDWSHHYRVWPAVPERHRTQAGV